jgi:hypothetical protein
VNARYHEGEGLEMSLYPSAIIALAPLVLLFGPPLSAADLAISQLTLHEYEDGPPLPSSPRFGEGQTVHLSFLIQNYTPTKDEDAPKVQLFHSFTVIDPEGRPLVPTKTGEVEGVLSPEDKEWLPKVRYSFKVPESPSSGIHSVQVRVKDQISGQEAGGTIAFRIEVPAFEEKPTLGIQSFRYLRTEDEKSALGSEGAVRPGDEFFARFLITGHKLGEGNKYNVRYGLSFVDEAGKAIFASSDMAAVAGESFYPRRYLPVSIALGLNPQVKLGRYRLKLTVEDLVGAQKIEAEYPISVER